MKFKRLMALAMAGVMTLGMAGTAMAANTAGNDKVITGGLEFTKNATADSSVISIESDLKFTLADTAAFAIKDTEGKEVTYDKAGTLDFGTSGTITVAGSELTGGSGSFTVDKDIDTAFKTAISSVDKPGVYYATLTESTTAAAESDNYFGWTKVSDKTYYIAAFATKKDDSYDVKYVAYEAGTSGADLTKKVTELAFENTYNKKSGSDDEENPTPSLKLTKAVANGDYVPADQAYSFKVTITLPDVSADSEGTKHCKATVTVTGNGSAAQSEITGDVTDFAVTLQKDAAVSFENLPVGTKVTIKEDVSGLTSMNFKEAAFSGDATGSGSIGEVASNEITLDEDGQDVLCTNTFTNITPTGLAISVAPFIAMFAAVGAAIALYVAARRRVH